MTRFGQKSLLAVDDPKKVAMKGSIYRKQKGYLMNETGLKSNGKTIDQPGTENETGSMSLEAAEAKPYSFSGAGLLVLFCVYLMIKLFLNAVFEGAALSPSLTLVAGIIPALPILIIADIMGARYIVSISHVERRGFFGLPPRRFDWDEITEIVLCKKRFFMRDMVIESGRRRIQFGAGVILWRGGFFQTAEKAVAIAESRGITITKKGFEGNDGVEEWFEIGREGLFRLSKVQLPPKSPLKK